MEKVQVFLQPHIKHTDVFLGCSLFLRAVHAHVCEYAFYLFNSFISINTLFAWVMHQGIEPSLLLFFVVPIWNLWGGLHKLGIGPCTQCVIVSAVPLMWTTERWKCFYFFLLLFASEPDPGPWHLFSTALLYCPCSPFSFNHGGSSLCFGVTYGGWSACKFTRNTHFPRLTPTHQGIIIFA